MPAFTFFIVTFTCNFPGCYLLLFSFNHSSTTGRAELLEKTCPDCVYHRCDISLLCFRYHLLHHLQSLFRISLRLESFRQVAECRLPYRQHLGGAGGELSLMGYMAWSARLHTY